MATIQDVTPEQLARLIYRYREALRQDRTSETNPENSWDKVSQDDQLIMIAAVRLALLELSTVSMTPDTRSYYAQPGEAEWGC